MTEMTQNDLKKELWAVFGGLGLIFVGLFALLPLFVAISPELPFLGLIPTIPAVLVGLILLGWAFTRYRIPDLVDLIKATKESLPEDLTRR
jgi:hypothetical protein